MKQLTAIGVSAVLAMGSLPALAEPTEQRMFDAFEVMRDFTAIPEQAIPPNLLNNAYGVAVLPGVVKVGFGIGGRYGKGVLTVRREDGSWSNPVFVSLGGGSIGWQIGAQSTDLVLIFKDRRSITDIANGKLTFGGNASAAAGPVGRQASAATDGRMNAEIYSYSRSRGLFAGIALDGAWIGMDTAANQEFYRNGLSPLQLLDAGNVPAPMAAQQLLSVLNQATPRLQSAGNRQTAQAAPAGRAPAMSAPPAEVRTYALDPVNGGGDETLF